MDNLYQSAALQIEDNLLHLLHRKECFGNCCFNCSIAVNKGVKQNGAVLKHEVQYHNEVKLNRNVGLVGMSISPL